jgi:hypothetical protein
MLRDVWPEPSPSGDWRDVARLLHAERGARHHG